MGEYYKVLDIVECFVCVYLNSVYIDYVFYLVVFLNVCLSDNFI